MVNKKKGETIEEKLRILYNLQLIDSRIDEIKKFHLNKPLEIKSLEEELDQSKNITKEYKEKIFSLKERIISKNNEITSSDILIKKYEKQKDHVKNNNELYFLNKEIDYQKLEIQLLKKKIQKLEIKISENKNQLKKKENLLKNKKEYLLHKKKELNHIHLENKKEEKLLLERYLLFSIKSDKKLLQTYKQIRKGVKNGIAVAPVQRGAPLGSYLAITPQKYSELIQRNKILIDENSGRILIDSELAEEEKKKYSSFFLQKEK
ncbi:zinc ribbon domain-containing protein [Blattabacterium cuenoti]|uniref:zinc ribbon domain-containing protein n=1 Tax=Blattabacterium cuenoti TaxID=1653831 RepID=UPI00163CD2BA|nr:hypothetical protein [Blattabacterium cuenoti]